MVILCFILVMQPTCRIPFIFQGGMTNELKNAWSWPIPTSDEYFEFGWQNYNGYSDAGAMQITVDSGIAQYNYILSAQTK